MRALSQSWHLIWALWRLFWQPPDSTVMDPEITGPPRTSLPVGSQVRGSLECTSLITIRSSGDFRW